MEALLDQADALVAAARAQPTAAEPPRPRPDFAVPEEYGGGAALDAHRHMVLRECCDATSTRTRKKKGRGYFARHDVPAGTLLLVAKPLAMAMDWEDDRADDGEDFERTGNDEEEESMDEEPREPRLNELLLLRLLEQLADEEEGTGIALWKDRLTTLFPRDEAEVAALPAWVCHDDEVFLRVEALLSAVKERNGGQLSVREISRRLPLIIRYNVLSFETCPELLSHPSPGGHSRLSGVALYHEPSFFNHSRRPNVSRWSIGDVMAFVTNRDVPAGDELCISYLEHDVLCEPAHRRNAMLSMDFVDVDSDGDDGEQADSEDDGRQQDGGGGGPELPVVDSDVQNELMAMDPFQRLSAIDELLQQALGEKLPEDELEEGGMETEAESWFRCDAHNLRILKAITLEGLGQSAEALRLWDEAVQFAERHLPPADESLVVLHAQAALCALRACEGYEDDHRSEEQEEAARRHAAAAIETHDLLFGGGVARFRRRMDRDLRLELRPAAATAESEEQRHPEDVLWPLSP